MKKRKTALVLGGGGSRGAYEVGVWQGLRELGIKIDLVTGTSVGAINGAFVAQDAFDLAVALWKEVETSMVFDMEIKDIITNSGIGTTKLKALLDKFLDEGAIRRSPIGFGLVTVEFPSMDPLFLMIDQIPEKKLSDYILASSALFPALKVHEIGEKKYVDGGFSDNLPVGMAIDHGATHVIAVDLDVVGFINKDTFLGAEHLKIIRCPWNLGNMLIFNKTNSKKIMRLGYLDTMKAYGIFEGQYYCFVKDSIESKNLLRADIAGKIFELDPGIIYFKKTFNDGLRKAIADHPMEKEHDFFNGTSSFTNLLSGSVEWIRSIFNPKTITLLIARSFKDTPIDKNIFLTKPGIKLFRNEIFAANYIYKEGLV
ncbi:MAG: patatin-like phospholipase family protein [Anaerovoracaceae bacterium]